MNKCKAVLATLITASVLVPAMAYDTSSPLAYNFIGVSYQDTSFRNSPFSPTGWRADGRVMLTDHIWLGGLYQHLTGGVKSDLLADLLSEQQNVKLTELGMQVGYRFPLMRNTDLNTYLHYSTNKHRETLSQRDFSQRFDAYGAAIGFSHWLADSWDLSVKTGYRYDQKWRGLDENHGRLFLDLGAKVALTQSLQITTAVRFSDGQNSWSTGLSYRF
ncbi:outer membrane beta-barrel protein [Alkalimonas delamerensis]|uniref:Outer membrane beta-barrel protein n=1 Tax=Alkalimonas delamerensis TaxID=265981 RepID=A0ABT9GS98_9GAMM|nr:outer membrane beta-barrel protein [Alkalimonas delamerensis]MDP4529853.1 outer membrane beta-barrel protein [Alkalimonas delamerensis]